MPSSVDLTGLHAPNSTSIGSSVFAARLRADVIWESEVSMVVHAVWNVVFFYAVVLCVFVVCYWRILVTIRRQARVMAAHSGAASSNASQAQSNQIHILQVREQQASNSFGVEVKK